MGGCCSTIPQEEEEIHVETTSLVPKQKKTIDLTKTNFNKPPIIEIIQPVTPSVDLLKSWDQDNLIRSPELLKRSFLKGFNFYFSTFKTSGEVSFIVEFMGMCVQLTPLVNKEYD
jgi:hypothetical protein